LTRVFDVIIGDGTAVFSNTEGWEWEAVDGCGWEPADPIKPTRDPGAFCLGAIVSVMEHYALIFGVGDVEADGKAPWRFRPSGPFDIRTLKAGWDDMKVVGYARRFSLDQDRQAGLPAAGEVRYW
jgi:hypothetical protein